MKKSLEISFIILILATLAGVGFSNLYGTVFALIAVLGLAVFKFLLVGFEFMELKIANPFWKFMIVFYVLLICTIMIVTLM